MKSILPSSNAPSSVNHQRASQNCLLVAVMMFVLTLAAPLRAEQMPESVVDVQIEGNETIPTSIILQKILTQPGRPITNRQLREDKRKLMNTRLFYNVSERFQTGPNGTVLIFKVHERPIVQKVAFLGIKKLKRKELASWTGLKVGSPFDHIANREAVHRIEQEYKERGYYFVKVTLQTGGEPTDRKVIFRVNEGPKVRVQDRAFEFVSASGKKEPGSPLWMLPRTSQNGAVGLSPSASRLKTKLVSKEALFGFFGGHYKPETMEQDVAAIKQYYRGLGFFGATVKAKPLFSRDRSSVRLLYTVNEGVPYKIRNIEINGNNVVSTKQLRATPELRKGDYFNSLPLSKDVKAMLSQYEKRGHYFASVVPVPKFTEEPGIVDIAFEIDEDRPRYVRNINVQMQGDHPHTMNVVPLNQFQMEPGDLADPTKIRRGRSRIAGSGIFEQNVDVKVVPVDVNQIMTASHSRNIRGQDGAGTNSTWAQLFSSHNSSGMPKSVTHGHSFPSAALKPTTSRLPQQSQLSPQASYAPTTSRETNSTSLQLSNIFHQPPRDLLVSSFSSPEEAPVIRGQSPNGYYQAPEPDRGDLVLEGSPYNNQFQALPPGWVDINVSAAEGRTGRLMFGAGVNSDAGIVGSFVWDERNFNLFRPPQTFADIIDGRAWRGGGQRFRLEAAPGDQVSRYAVSWTDPYFMYSDFSLGLSGFYFNRFYPDWDETRLGGRITVGKQLTPEWSVNAALRMEDIDINNPRTTASSLNTTSVPELEAVRGSNTLYSIRTSISHDTRDSTLFPGEGHFMDVAYEQAFGTFSYPRFEGEGRQYFTMHQRPDGSGRHVLTLAGNLGWSGDDTPVFERYFAGGFQSFRGFAFRGVTPRGEDDISTGGTWQMLGTAEYRVPVTADDMINLVVFSDVGTVEQEVTADNFRVTVGVGLRVVVPAMGPVPLAFDFGFPIRSARGDDERIFSFYVGINR